MAGLRLGLLEISTIFVPFRKSRSTKLKSLLHSILRSSPPAPLLFYIKVEWPLSRWQIAEGGTEHWAVFPFPSASSVPKEGAQLQGTNADTLELLILLSPSLFFFFFLQDPPGWIHFLLWEIKWHSCGGGGVTAFISSRKWSVFCL